MVAAKSKKSVIQKKSAIRVKAQKPKLQPKQQLQKEVKKEMEQEFVIEKTRTSRWGMFLLVFGATFIIVALLSFNFPEVRNALHRSFNGIFLAEGNVTADAKLEQKSPFTDVAINHKNYDAIVYLTKNGITKGYDNGSFKPDNTLNRAELLKLVVAALKVDPHQLSNSFCFKDVKDEWFATAVCYAKNKGWVGGFVDGNFHPEKDVSKAEAIKIIVVAFAFKLVENSPEAVFPDVNSNDWFAKYIWTAQQEKLLEENAPQDSVGPNNPISRALVAEILYRSLLSNLPTI